MSENNIPIRHLPKHVIITRLKRAHVRQGQIARRAGVSQATVSRVIARILRDTDLADAVWREIERALGHHALA